MLYCSLQEQLRSERSELAAWKSSEEAALERHRQELRADSERLQAQRAELRQQRDELHKQKETLQRQMDLFEEAQHKAAQAAARERSHSPATAAAGLEISHKRSASDDLYNSGSRSDNRSAAEHSNSLKEARSTGFNQMHHQPDKSRSQSVSGTRGKEHFPVHLNSATNQQKHAITATQMLPSKLAADSSAARPLSASSVSSSRPPSRPSSSRAPVRNNSSGSGPLSPPAPLIHAKSHPHACF